MVYVEVPLDDKLYEFLVKEAKFHKMSVEDFIAYALEEEYA